MSEYSTIVNGLKISVDKNGGGTVGRKYDGLWTVTVKQGKVRIFDREELSTGTPKTHAQAARLAYEFATSE